MYLHLGGDKVVFTSDIIGIFDMDKTTCSKITKDFLAGCEKQKQVVNISEELPKSFILCRNESGTKVYISQISSTALKERGSFKNNSD